MRSDDRFREQLSHLGAAADANIGLAETALALGRRFRPRTALEPYRRHLERVARDVDAYAGETEDGARIHIRAEALAQVVTGRYGYRGADDRHDGPVDHANLLSVIDRRRGSAVSLGIIYLEVCRLLGWTCGAVDFPVRMLVRLENEGRREILDPYDHGRRLHALELRTMLMAERGPNAELRWRHTAPLEKREILVRLESGIKDAYLREGRLEDARDVIETMVLFAPAAAALWRESGLISAKLGDVRAAVAALEESLRLGAGDAGSRRTSALLQELRGRLG
ncbi:MAG: transglutaminase-like domain-containing protein [Rhodospirillales bacterium]|jgi:regulator of sirC expression with transglutaminase-like and TPR domain|nr:transglutaminase-like domain-containing protein [Rhodospirillales bacterium]MDP6804074.1 transglutaminase-like domain-containing protein [Rhodospirillales bacterium]